MDWMVVTTSGMICYLIARFSALLGLASIAHFYLPPENYQLKIEVAERSSNPARGGDGPEVSKGYYIVFVIFLVLLALGLWQGEYLTVYLKAKAI